MPPRHPETELIPYLRGELSARDRERVAGHVRGCAGCSRGLEAYRDLLGSLRASVPRAPDLHWGRYRAELRARLEDRVGPRPTDGAARRPRWAWPAPLALATSLAAVVLVFALRGGVREAGRGDDLLALQEVVIGRRLELLEDYTLLEQLDLLENFEVIRDLDRLAANRES